MMGKHWASKCGAGLAGVYDVSQLPRRLCSPEPRNYRFWLYRAGIVCPTRSRSTEAQSVHPLWTDCSARRTWVYACDWLSGVTREVPRTPWAASIAREPVFPRLLLARVDVELVDLAEGGRRIAWMHDEMESPRSRSRTPTARIGRRLDKASAEALAHGVAAVNGTLVLHRQTPPTRAPTRA